MPRKGNKIYKRNDGRYEGRYMVSRDENGKAKYKAVYGHSEEEVREKLEIAKREVPDEVINPVKSRTFREVAEEWLANNKDSLASTTYDRYEDALIRDIYPEYADTPMEQVTIEEMNRFMGKAPELAKERGRTLKESALQIVRTVMSNVIQYACEEAMGWRTDLSYEAVSYEELTSKELEQICFRAKFNHCPEMLAALLSIYCGLRTGEICGLSCDDVDLSRMELYIHSIAHRVRNQDEDSDKKTCVIIDEIARKNQIRRVKIPASLKDYVSEYMLPGRELIRGRDGVSTTDPRSLENRLIRVMDAFKIPGISFERLRKTYMKGKADEEILNNVFLGIRPEKPYTGALDISWLTDEMVRDLVPLRLLLGVSQDEMGKMLGVSESELQSIEAGKQSISWDQYLTMLFIFHYNGRTGGIVENLGLYPKALQESIKIGR